MDEAIDRYVGGVKHVTMNVYIYTDISGIFDVTIHDSPSRLDRDPFGKDRPADSFRIAKSHARSVYKARWGRTDGILPGSQADRSRYERDITVRSPAAWL
jgi:hypothetical protein